MAIQMALAMTVKACAAGCAVGVDVFGPAGWRHTQSVPRRTTSDRVEAWQLQVGAKALERHMKIGHFSVNLRSFSRTSKESTRGGESAHAGRASDTNATLSGAAIHAAGQGDREAIPTQPPLGTRPAEVERFLDSAALSAIEFQTPDFNKYDIFDRAAESIEGFTRDLYRHSPTFRNAIHEATGAGTAQPSRIRMIQGKIGDDVLARFYHHTMQVRTDTLHPELKNYPGRSCGAATFELFNAAALKRFNKLDQDAKSGVYEQQAQGSNLTSAQLDARDNEYQEWLNIKAHHQALSEAKAEGMHVPPGADCFIEVFGTAERPGPWTDFNDYYAKQVDCGHTQLCVEQYYGLRASPGTQVD